MFQMKNEQQTEIRRNVRGGNGALPFCHVFSAQQLAGRASMLARVALAPGESIGEHPHTENAEAYYVLSGELAVTEDGICRILHAGDAELCADGHVHAIENRSAQPAEFLALILPNREGGTI